MPEGPEAHGRGVPPAAGGGEAELVRIDLGAERDPGMIADALTALRARSQQRSEDLSA